MQFYFYFPKVFHFLLCFCLVLMFVQNFISFAVLPDFGQVYSFLGSIFDPNVTGHLQKLKTMDPIDVETVCFLIFAVLIHLLSMLILE